MSIRIGMGAGLGGPAGPEDYWRWAELCERSGIDSIWHSDQLVRPGLEPMVMMAALAKATKTLRFGMNAVVISHRDPLVLAKECATIDYLAPGRLLPVFGVGEASDPAWTATGRSPKGRGGLANEAITLVRRLLAEESVTFEGQHFRYQEARLFPRPKKPIPIWIGGDSEAAIQRTALLGDGWLGGLTSPSIAGDVVARIKAALKDTGRRIDEDHYGVVVPFRLGDDGGAEVERYRRAVAERRGQADAAARPRAIAAGDADAVADLFKQYVDVGVSKFVAIPLARDPLDLLVQTERLADEILPKIED
jgi:probable F420-dependent oxidoreductase